MRKKKNKYLEFYEAYFGKQLPRAGLCSVFEGFFDTDPVLNTLHPTEANLDELRTQGLHTSYWGSGLGYAVGDEAEYASYYEAYEEIRYAFTPLRQTIVLFMAQLKEDELYEED